jgi:hypothetical protein
MSARPLATASCTRGAWLPDRDVIRVVLRWTNLVYTSPILTSRLLRDSEVASVPGGEAGSARWLPPCSARIFARTRRGNKEPDRWSGERGERRDGCCLHVLCFRAQPVLYRPAGHASLSAPPNA